MKNRNKALLFIALFLVAALATSWFIRDDKPAYSESIKNVPAFSGNPYVVINQNQPEFTDADITTESYEFYSELDSLNRCGYAMACIGQDLMPHDDRGSIGQIKPSGWQTVKYDFIDGKYLYNRCHLIGFQLTGENANECNLITGTRYMNTEGMLPFENMVADYIKETNHHVMYRVTPIFTGEEQIARGVQMEAYSVEDQGEGICFNVYVYNNQPGVVIDYLSGNSWAESASADTGAVSTYILNNKSKKFHDPDCSLAENIHEENREEFSGQRQTLIDRGYSPCGSCDP